MECFIRHVHYTSYFCTHTYSDEFVNEYEKTVLEFKTVEGK